ncbi:hypothetical protein BSZ39_03595 [Bowdeniella nasicola]|uniref:Coproheme decarboxylase n=1 Tax=Bowdeniella nasicola TaxID=208480 RepID=A0A1Q5Q420_9ACTO|nr:hydrogen peroxide-dependent heme synthase [Bowdeniella nasicola]OKL54551.1 hypothetical protein BSZ39_03595 [Bowdeniella nasicola]
MDITKKPSASVRDHRDGPRANRKDVNELDYFSLHAVFALTDALPADDADRAQLIDGIAAATKNVTLRGWYDVSGFRADADIMMWIHGEDVDDLQAAYHEVRNLLMGYFEPVWSVVSTHRPSEFNRGHIPAILDNFGPRDYICVYPFVRSYEWYTMAPEKRAKMLAEHGISGREFPDVLASTLSAFALGDYEWVLSFEADHLNRLVDAMRHQRGVEARHHVREEIPFFTGPRVDFAELLGRQPRA